MSLDSLKSYRDLVLSTSSHWWFFYFYLNLSTSMITFFLHTICYKHINNSKYIVTHGPVILCWSMDITEVTEITFSLANTYVSCFPFPVFMSMYYKNTIKMLQKEAFHESKSHVLSSISCKYNVNLPQFN